MRLLLITNRQLQPYRLTLTYRINYLNINDKKH